MSILFTSDVGFYIDHRKFIEKCYENVSTTDNVVAYKLHGDLFKIMGPYKNKAKSNLKRFAADEEINNVKSSYDILKNQLLKNGILKSSPEATVKNNEALEMSENIYNKTGENPISNAFGENKEGMSVVKLINDQEYLFPNNCKFFCKDVKEIKGYLQNELFDVIVLDPPWWNKYIRRKKRKTDHGYKMMYNDDLKDIPVDKLLSNDGLVVIWCTNSKQNLEQLLGEVFEVWTVKFLSKWYWVKITNTGETVCSFSEPKGKQPFEQIIFAAREVRRDRMPINGKIVASVPSSLHSHKPPLLDLIKPYVRTSPKVLEIFARYLLPNCTSYGLETLRFQHVSLYEINTEKTYFCLYDNEN